MKRSYLIIVILLIASCAPTKKLIIDENQKSITFTNLNEMDFPRYGIGYTADSENIYVVDGARFKYPALLPDISKYNIEQDNWDVLTTKLIARRYTSVQKIDNNIYIFNGQNFTRKMDGHLEIFDINTGQLTFGSKVPFPVMHAGSAVWEGKIYVFGGSVDEKFYVNKLYVYDPKLDYWKRLADIPVNIHFKGEIVDGILYCFGGYNGGDESEKGLYTYNIKKDKWRKVGDMPVGVSANGIAKHDKNIWLTGSYDDLSQIAVFNTETYEFSLVESNMEPRRHSGAAVINDKLYVFGGNKTSRGPAIASVQVTDLEK